MDIVKYATDLWCTEITKELLLIRFPCLARARTTFHILQMPDPQDHDFAEAMEGHEAQQVSGSSCTRLNGTRGSCHTTDCSPTAITAISTSRACSVLSQVVTASGETFAVMAIPSQHCDGAAMLLFEVCQLALENRRQR